MERQDSKRKGWVHDTRGFTLVELMLAVALLGVITIPILSYFTDSAKHNARSRTKQNATVAAQDILEGFKNSAYSLDDCNVVCSAAPDWSVKTAPGATGTYTLTRNMTIDKHTFTVEADITPLKGVASGGGIGKEYERMVIGTMDSNKDLMASAGATISQNAELYFKAKYADLCSQASQVASTTVSDGIPSQLTCTIEIEGEGKGANENDEMVMKVNYIYTYKGTGGKTSDNIDLSGVKYKENIESESFVAKDMENIYIFYRPLNDGETVRLKSNTEFDSAVKIDQLRLFLIAQSSVPAGETPPTGQTARKSGYKVTLDSSGNSFGSKIKKVYTNLTLKNSEINNNGDALIGKLKTAVDKTGSLDYALVDSEEINRVAKISVRVLKDSQTYVTVTGSKVQN